MKSEADVRKRLDKLRSKYLNKHVRETQRRFHKNCVFNSPHAPKPLPYSEIPDLELERAPRKSRTLVVLQESSVPVRICMYGADTPESWLGNTCDDDSVSSTCPMFRPHVSAHEAAFEFETSMMDDRSVLESYPDVAALQWVLEERVFTRPFLHRFWTFILGLVLAGAARVRKVFVKGADRTPPGALPPGFWDDPPSNP